MNVLIQAYLVLALLGFCNAGYLWWQQRKPKPLICPLDHDCSVVTQSRWSHLFYVRNEVLGLAFFGTVVLSLVVAVANPVLYPVILQYLFYACIGAAVFSLFLVYVQVSIIKDYCFYCMLSALITLLMFGVSALLV